MPIGLYLLQAPSVAKGTLVAIRLQEPIRSLASARGYLPAGALLIKRIVADRGDVVCRFGGVVTVNGRVVARARMVDGSVRPLLRWQGCVRLSASQIFALAPAADSFDSRYIGPIDRHAIVGTVRALWIPDSGEVSRPDRYDLAAVLGLER